jgi:hypothetical protein
MAEKNLLYPSNFNASLGDPVSLKVLDKNKYKALGDVKWLIIVACKYWYEQLCLTQSEHNSFEGSLDDISENGASLILSVPFESCLSPFQRGDFLNYW